MFEHLKLRNFRLFDSLEVSELGRINLFTGLNNSGKTSLLEALFLLSGGGNPGLALTVNAMRGIDSATGTTQTIQEILWKPLFSTLDMGREIEFSGRHSSLGHLKLTIRLSRQETIQLPFDVADVTLSHSLGTGHALEFS